MQPFDLLARERLTAVAWCIGERLDLRALEQMDVLARLPLTLRAGRDGLAIAFRYGVVVFFELEPVEQTHFLEMLRPWVSTPFETPQSDAAEIRVEKGQPARVEAGGTIALGELGLPQLQVIAHVLAKSAVLAHHERDMARVVERIDPLVERLQAGGRRVRGSDVLREIGLALSTQVRTVGRAEVSEAPEMTWDDPGLTTLFKRLAEEYELRERDLILDRKLAVVSHSAQTFLDLLHNRRSLRVEWYIVALILGEILLSLYERSGSLLP
jgi:uncharacterized Rmd1/YagE family protein